jgi:hypothetical protein
MPNQLMTARAKLQPAELTASDRRDGVHETG